MCSAFAVMRFYCRIVCALVSRSIAFGTMVESFLRRHHIRRIAVPDLQGWLLNCPSEGER
jgi:hypothetical protein